MLREIPDPRQIPGEASRRWFSGSNFDLIVWCEEDGAIIGFQLCYGKLQGERALTWKRGTGYVHTTVDDGEGRSGKYKETPLLVQDGAFDAAKVAAQFRAHSSGIDQSVATFVLDRVLAFPCCAVLPPEGA